MHGLPKAGLILLVGWLALVAGRAESVVLHLRNGDRLTGTIVAETTNQVTVLTLWKEKVAVPVAQIERREKLPPPPSPPPVAPKPAAGQPAAPTPPAPVITQKMQQELDELLTLYDADKITPGQYQEQRAQILGESAPTTTVAAGTQTAQATPATPGTPPSAKAASPPAKPAPASATATPPPPKVAAKKPKNWKTQINVGFLAVINQARTETYTANAQYDYLYKRLQETVNLNGVYSQASGVTAANRLFGSEKTTVTLAEQKKLYAYNLVDGFYDQIQRIALQYDVGPGLGYELIKKPKFVLDVEAGGNYTSIVYSNDGSQNNISLRLAEHSTWNINPKTKLFEEFAFFPQQGKTSSYQFRFNSTLSYALSTWLNLNMGMIDFYYSVPARGATRNSLQVNTTLGITF